MSYTDLSEDDQFKRKDNIYKTDLRYKIWGVANDINYLHDQLSPLLLNSKIPEDIRIEFEAAKNVFLYSHFSYRLTNISAQIALGVLEKFLKFHLNENLNIEIKKDTLAPLVNYYLTEKIITSDFFHYSVHYNSDEQALRKNDQQKLHFYFEHLITRKRNNLTHDLHKADIPWNNLDVLRDVTAIINYLYKEM